jgi:deoxyribodipyrimidine photo-lyase
VYTLLANPGYGEEDLDPSFRKFRWAKPEQAKLRAWQRGETGVPLVDAGMRELWHTGWMHNRVRMVAASFLTKNLRYHWLHGARWFWDTLVDADLANNSQGWQWTAGTGADAAPYFRVFNPARQGERFDPRGQYVRRWVPELAQLPDKALHAPWEHGELVRKLAPGYPATPIVDLAASREAALAAFRQRKE